MERWRRESYELRAVGASGSCPRFGACVSLSFGESVRLELRVSCRVEASRVLICFKGQNAQHGAHRREDCFISARHARTATQWQCDNGNI